ncbi:molybdopterin-containing oxidoreductase family protein [Sphingobium subterraneum]|uniref:Anaerobic selenocysteine-containing dehydrogenase n=1 Tax=Sphingobium subterraneum TaxID=627688 RepID=A0A841J9Y6_9SPHN|nr:molybdopterin-dependent oxidoreductase [Sphingobium subterraneum]MBB6125315.1 anaerobic selenocysteine-containing dehydrogenase [Sphingobium subterraneum]
MQSTHKSFCRNCTHSCGVVVTVENGRATTVKPDHDHPVTEGYFCIKARASLELHEGGDGRVTECLKRSGHDDWTRLDTSQALDEIGDRLKAIVEKHGPRSVAVYMGTGGFYNSLAHPLAKALLHEIGSPNFFSSASVDQSARWVSMMRMGFLASGKPNPADVDALMLVGANPLISHWLPAFNPAKRLREWSRKGTRTIVVDPRYTETAKLADLHLPLRPGEDVTLFAGLVRIVLENGWQDRDFCDRYAGRLEQLRTAVEPYTLDYVHRRTQVTPDKLVEAARIFACSGKSLLITGTGIAMAPRSNLAMHMADTLNALCGGWRRPGDWVSNPGVLLSRTFSDTVIAPSRPWESGIQCHSAPTGLVQGEMPTGALPDEILTPGENRIRALVVLGGNPLKALGQPEKTMRAFRELDLLVSLDPRMSDTSRLSHYVVPPPLPYERHDLNYVLDGIGWSTKPFLQYAEPITAPPPHVVDESRFFWHVAGRMGLQLEYRKIGLLGLYRDAAPGFPLDMTSPPHPEDLARWWVRDTPVDFDELRASPGGLLVDVPGQAVAASPDDGVRMDLCPDDIACELAQVHAEQPDTKGSYRLATRRIRETLNSMYRSTQAAERNFPVNPAFMNPDDMKDEGLQPGDRIVIASRHGSLQGTVREDRDLGRGTISMAQCFGESDLERDPDQRTGSFTGRLVSLEEDVEAINHMPVQTGIVVTISKSGLS